LRKTARYLAKPGRKTEKLISSFVGARSRSERSIDGAKVKVKGKYTRRRKSGKLAQKGVSIAPMGRGKAWVG